MCTINDQSKSVVVAREPLPWLWQMNNSEVLVWWNRPYQYNDRVSIKEHVNLWMQTNWYDTLANVNLSNVEHTCTWNANIHTQLSTRRLFQYPIRRVIITYFKVWNSHKYKRRYVLFIISWQFADALLHTHFCGALFCTNLLLSIKCACQETSA